MAPLLSVKSWLLRSLIVEDLFQFPHHLLVRTCLRDSDLGDQQTLGQVEHLLLTKGELIVAISKRDPVLIFCEYSRNLRFQVWVSILKFLSRKIA